MTHGLETRLPLLDNEVVDFGQAIPLKYKGYFNKFQPRFDENTPGNKFLKSKSDENISKLILREVMSRYLPESIASGKKKGFSAPDATWFRGRSIDFVQKIVTNKKRKMYDIVDQKTVLKMVDQHMSGEKNRRLFLWAILSFDEYIEGSL